MYIIVFCKKVHNLINNSNPLDKLELFFSTKTGARGGACGALQQQRGRPVVRTFQRHGRNV